MRIGFLWAFENFFRSNFFKKKTELLSGELSLGMAIFLMAKAWIWQLGKFHGRSSFYDKPQNGTQKSHFFEFLGEIFGKN